MDKRKKSARIYAARGFDESEINIIWDADEKATGYVVQVKKGDGKWKQIDITKEPQYTISGLGHGMTYTFRVASVYSAGQSKWSDEIVKKIGFTED